VSVADIFDLFIPVALEGTLIGYTLVGCGFLVVMLLLGQLALRR
jgi:hypothetical protein